MELERRLRACRSHLGLLDRTLPPIVRSAADNPLPYWDTADADYHVDNPRDCTAAAAAAERETADWRTVGVDDLRCRIALLAGIRERCNVDEESCVVSKCDMNS